MVFVLVMVYIVDTMTLQQLLLRKTFNWVAHSFRGLLPYHHGRKYGSMQAGMVLVRELRDLHLNLKATVV